jgi:tight adherence protein C
MGGSLTMTGLWTGLIGVSVALLVYVLVDLVAGGGPAAARRTRILTGKAPEAPTPTKQAAEQGRRVDALLARIGLETLLVGPEAAALLVEAGWRSRRATRLYMILVITVPPLIAALFFALLRIYHVRLNPFWLEPLLLVGAILAGLLFPINMLRQRAAARRLALQHDWPDALDIMLLSVEAGMPVDQALRRVASEMQDHAPILAEELDQTIAELNYLDDRTRAYDNLGRRTGLSEIRAVTQALIQAERYGTSMGTVLRTMSEEGRETRTNFAEKRASALPPLMTVPLVLFFMPVLFVVIFAPGLIRMFGENLPF